MRVFIASAVFPPEPLTTALTSADLAAELANRGHDVVVYAPFPNRPAGRLFEGYRRRIYQCEARDGLKVVHTWHTLSESSSIASRFAENISFGVSSSLAMGLARRPQVMYLNTWPIFAQSFNVALGRWRGIPVVCSVQDIYPDTLVNKQKLDGNGVLVRGVRLLDSELLRRCARVVTISDGMREFLLRERGLPPERVVTVPNWMSAAAFDPALPRAGSFRRRQGIPDETFLAIFAGSLTMSAGVELFIEAAEKLRDERDIMILLVGDGTRRAWAEQEIQRRRLSNIRVVYPLVPAEVAGVQAAADVLLLSLTGETSQNAAPSKQVAYMLSGRAIVASVSQGSPPAQILDAARAGIVVPPDDAGALARCLRGCLDRRDELVEMGRRARSYAEARLSRETLLPRLADLVIDAGREKL